MAPKGQLAISGLEDPEEAKREAEREADEQVLLFEHMLAACRAVARELTYDACATALDRIWGDRGRPVSSAVLRAALNDSRGNYFRLEWAIWFARQSEEVASVLAEIIGLGASSKPPDEELEDLKEVLLEEYPRQAQRLIRRARAKPRKQRRPRPI